MIVQEQGEAMLFFRQTDHALLSGAFSAAWGNEVIPAPARRDAAIVAAARHDDGWADWELAPKLMTDGRPVDFIHVPVRDHVPLYKRGIDLVAEEDLYAGLVASMHGERLYTRPFHPGMNPRIDHLEGDDLVLAKTYVDGELERQDALVARLGGNAATDGEECWRLLQVWDRLSLLVCMSRVGEGIEQKLPPIASATGDVGIVVRGADEGILSLDPFPFSETEVEFDIAYVRTPVKRWTDEPSFRADLRTARHETLRFRCVP